jgi:hypothetical protein
VENGGRKWENHDKTRTGDDGGRTMKTTRSRKGGEWREKMGEPWQDKDR